jgi:hypothetical protein
VAADRRFIGKRGCNLDPFSEQLKQLQRPPGKLKDSAQILPDGHKKSGVFISVRIFLLSED